MRRAVVGIISVVLAVGCVWAWSIWTPIGPGLFPVLCGAVSSGDPQVMVVAVSRGAGASLFRTTDRGVTWSAICESLSFRPRAISFRPGSDSVLYAVPGDVFRSTDCGQKWSRLPTPDATVWSGLGFNEADSSEVWLAGYSSASTRGRASAAVSTDAGANWTLFVCDGNERSASYSIAVDPTQDSVLYCGGSVAGQAVVYKSTDKGLSWARYDLPSPAVQDSVEPCRPPPQEEPVGGRARFLYVDPLDSSILLAAMSWFGVHRSTDAGATWTHYPDIPEAHALAWAPLQPEVVYVGVTGGIYRTQDAGANWSWRRQPPYSGIVGCVLTPADAANEALALTGDGVFRTTDQGNNWDPAGVLGSVTISALEVCRTAPQFEYVAIAGARVFRSTDGGVDWDRCRGFPGSDRVVGISAASIDEVWALADTGLNHSTDGGRTWALKGDLFDSAGAVSVSSLSADVVVTTGLDDDSSKTARFAIAVTTDRGQNWNHLLLCAGGMGRTVALSPTDPGRVLVGGDSAGMAVIYSSSDTGHTWQRTETGLSGQVRCLEFEPSGGRRLYCGTSDGAFYTADTGKTWQHTGLSEVNAVVYPQWWEVCAGTDSGVFLNQGGGWEPYSVGLVDPGVTSMGVGNSELFAGTRTAGLFRGYFPVGIADRPVDGPKRSGSFGAPVTRGTIFLREDCTRGKVCLIDVCGRRVMVLHPGVNDARGLTPGVYFMLEGPQAIPKVVLVE